MEVSGFKHEDNASCAIATSEGTRAWVGLDTNPGIVVQIDLTTMRKTALLELNPGEDGVSKAAIDPADRYGYFLVNSAPPRLLRIDLATFTRAGHYDFPADEAPDVLLMDPARPYRYAGIRARPGKVVRLDLATFTRKDDRENRHGSRRQYPLRRWLF